MLQGGLPEFVTLPDETSGGALGVSLCRVAFQNPVAQGRAAGCGILVSPG